MAKDKLGKGAPVSCFIGAASAAVVGRLSRLFPPPRRSLTRVREKGEARARGVLSCNCTQPATAARLGEAEGGREGLNLALRKVGHTPLRAAARCCCQVHPPSAGSSHDQKRGCVVREGGACVRRKPRRFVDRGVGCVSSSSLSVRGLRTVGKRSVVCCRTDSQ